MKNIKIVALLAAFTILFSSCAKDFMDTKSTQSVDQVSIFETTNSCMIALNGIHKLMYEPAGDCEGGFQSFMIWMDMLGEDLVYTTEYKKFNTHADWSAHRTSTNSYLAYQYRHFYRIINNANMLLENIGHAKGSEAEKEYIRGQALAYRAFAHFYLVQCWAKRFDKDSDNSQLGVILRVNSGTEPLARVTVANVYKKINEDLDEAISLLDKVKGSVKKTNKTHIDVHVARGIKARVLLTQGQWREAAEMAKKVVEESGAKLQADTYTTFAMRFLDQTNTEWLWGKKGLEDQGGNGDFTRYMSNQQYIYNESAPRAIYNLLYNKISPTDVRKTIWLPTAQDLKSQPRPVIPNHGSICNYMAQKFLMTDPTMNNADLPWMRLPEMMLIEAEGYARAGEDALAAQALYPLAVHRDPQYTLSTNTGQDLIDEIMIQRRVELWGEGFRFLDLKRLNQALDRGPAPRKGYSTKTWSTTKTTESNAKMPTNVDPEASNFRMYGNGIIRESSRIREVGASTWQFIFPKTEQDNNPLWEADPK